MDVQERVKGALGAEQIHLEEDGGDVPSVKVSGLKGQGLDTLVETLGVLAEVRDLRANVDGRGEGWVLESRVEKGRGWVRGSKEDSATFRLTVLWPFVAWYDEIGTALRSL